MYIYFYTFGCKVNQYETEVLKQRFEALENTVAESVLQADMCVINTCTVTSAADLKLRQLIHKFRRENPLAIIALVGCYPQAFGDGLGCDIVLGTKNKQNLPEAVEKFLETGNCILDIPSFDGTEPDNYKLLSAGEKTRGVIKIQDGCDRFCSYCIIPYARGRSRSKPIDVIRSEAATLSLFGQKEIVIVGINLSDYGKGTENNLADAALAASDGGCGSRIRLGSLEPEELTPDIIRRLAGIKNICPHFHLALQSGCDRTLTQMRRKYNKAEYLEIVNEFRRHFPGCAITTDIMVGFPGETDKDFNESLETVNEIGFADAHIFTYSRRNGTPAAKMDDQIPKYIKAERAKIMAEAVEKSAEQYSLLQIGKVLEVLFEREKTPDFHRGHSENYQIVNVKHFTDTMYREMRSVKITGLSEIGLIGEIV